MKTRFCKVVPLSRRFNFSITFGSLLYLFTSVITPPSSIDRKSDFDLKQKLLDFKSRSEPITMLTAYDGDTAALMNEEGINGILVGDSVMNVIYGHKDTRGATMEMMLDHIQEVYEGLQPSKRAFLVADMPIHSYDTPEEALQNARKFLVVGADAVKLEGGKEVATIVRHLVTHGIPVMGHVGHTPQTAEGRRVKGRTREEAFALLEDVRSLEKAGALAIVVELVDAHVASFLSRAVEIPTIGIGAGSQTDGQILVSHDMWGETGFKPRFIRDFAAGISGMKRLGKGKKRRYAVKEYILAVKERRFPSEKESHFLIELGVFMEFEQTLKGMLTYL